MKRYFVLFFILLFSSTIKAQITGTISDKKNKKLAFVNVFIKNTENGTTTNDNGNYSLKLKKTGKYTVVFKYLGYKTIKKTINITKFPYSLDIVMTKDIIALNEVGIYSKGNLADRIIRNVILTRKEVRAKTINFEANFYAKGVYRIKNAPKKIVGFDLGDLGGGLDSTRSGVVYLSETVSKITKNAKNFKEQIIASKVSGNDNGYSFNQASQVDFNFYRNVVDLGENIISPVARYAFTYYKYKLLSSTLDGKHLIHKIQVIPKRATDNSFAGTIYIVDSDWQIYALDLAISGKQIQQPAVDKLVIKQNYSYTAANKLWTVFSQSIDFKFGMLGIKIDGKYTAVYSNYNFKPIITRKTFTREVVSYNKNSNKKNTSFWEKTRPVPLTQEEEKDYKLKDSIKEFRKTKKYLDSLDYRANKFKIANIVTGYNYVNTYRKTGYTIGSPLQIMFNTVQGWHGNMAFSYYKKNKVKRRTFRFSTSINYGISDKQLRPSAKVYYKFNDKLKPKLTISGGKKLMQFMPKTVSPLFNTISSLFFETNYAKFYDKTFGEINYGLEVLNGARVNANLAYEDRKGVFNTSKNIIINQDNKIYTSNNPLAPNDYTNAVIDNHSLYKFKIATSIIFGQDYITLPNRKINLSLFNKYPKFDLNYTKGFASSYKKYNFDFLEVEVSQKFLMGNKGTFNYNFKAGKFFNSKELSFVDYKHFDSNKTHVSLIQDYINSFSLIPYYDFSTNDSFIELHLEHQFNGYLLRKIPWINQLQLKLVAGANTVITNENKPYSELNIGLKNLGFGRYRFLRLDYVRSYHNGNSFGSFLFGLTL